LYDLLAAFSRKEGVLDDVSSTALAALVGKMVGIGLRVPDQRNDQEGVHWQDSHSDKGMCASDHVMLWRRSQNKWWAQY
jgi:hypothetical protein